MGSRPPRRLCRSTILLVVFGLGGIIQAVRRRHIPLLGLALAGCSLFPDVPPVVDQGASGGSAGAAGAAGSGSGGTGGLAGMGASAGSGGTGGVAGSGGSAGACAVASLSVDATADTYILRTPPGIHGAETALYVGGSGNGVRRSLLRFDLASLPAGAQVQKAELKLTPVQVQSGVGLIGVHRIRVTWNEMEASWSAPMSGFVWDGGDYMLLPTVVADLSGAMVGQPASFDVTTDVKIFALDPSNNFGWELLDENSTGAELTLSSREAASDKPVLEISYCP